MCTIQITLKSFACPCSAVTFCIVSNQDLSDRRYTCMDSMMTAASGSLDWCVSAMTRPLKTQQLLTRFWTCTTVKTASRTTLHQQAVQTMVLMMATIGSSEHAQSHTHTHTYMWYIYAHTHNTTQSRRETLAARVAAACCSFNFNCTAF